MELPFSYLRLLARVATFIVASFSVQHVNAAVITLDFEGVGPPFGIFNYIREYYNGGTSSTGARGPDYGVSFSTHAVTLCLSTPENECSNTSKGSLGDPNSQQSGLSWASDNEIFMNYAAGFDTELSFSYAAVYFPGSVSLYSGLNGTGALLATLVLPILPKGSGNPACIGAEFCPFSTISIAFPGIAQSVSFAGTLSQIVFDDVTFESNPSVVPLPSALPLFVTVLGGAGLLGWRRKQSQRQAVAAP